MNIAFLCVLIACAMPLILTGLSKAGGAKAGHRFDNNHPRAWLAKLSGWPLRANAAQQNSWEALPIFIAGVLMATVANVAQETIEFWAVWFIVARVLYSALYIADQASLRSLVWAIALAAPVRLMIAAL